LPFFFSLGGGVEITKTREQIVSEIVKTGWRHFAHVNSLSLFDLDKLYQRVKYRKKLELYLAWRCLHTFWNKEKLQQECRLKEGKTCKWSKDNIMELGCKKYQSNGKGNK